MDTEETIQIPRARFNAFTRVLEALVMGGRFSEEDLRIDVRDEDTFAEIETMLQIFAREYADALERAEPAQPRAAVDHRAAARLAIVELATPIIDVWDDIVTLPIVGIVDTQRSVEMTQKLLQRIATTKARFVIVDLTGVDMVDTATADHLGEQYVT